MEREADIQRSIDMAAYLDDRLGPSDRKTFEQTQADDNRAAEELAIVQAVMAARGPVPGPPQRLVQRAIGLYPSGGEGLDLVLSFLRGVLSIVGASKGVLLQGPFATAAVRAGDGNALPLVKMTKEFHRAIVAVHIEGTADRDCTFTVSATDRNTQGPLLQSRVELVSGSRELASLPLEKGTALFEQVRPGSYDLIVRKNDVVIGRMAVKIQG